MSKLTLSMDPAIVRRAKRFASGHGTSVSQLVARFLDVLAHPIEETPAPPVLRRLRGSLKGARVADYRDHLAEKYR